MGDSDSKPRCVFTPEVDQYFYQTPPSDGEIFLKIRENKGPGQVDIAKLWRLKLSSYKQKVLGTVERQSGLLEKLDQLRAFPGLWNGFQLGNIEKHLKLHTPEEVSHYLQHVHKTWQLITLDDPTIQKATDFQTVKRLELLAPAIFSADGAEVRRLISDGTLFPSVSAPSVRARIQDAMLQIVGLIPSITTFHQNMMLLSIVAKILRRHIVGDARSGSLRSAMMGCWQAPEKMLIEEAENSFYKLHFPPSFDLAYRQVFMSALRHFSRLSVVGPRCERGQSMNAAMVDDQYLAQFLRGAWKQGFRSVKIEATLAKLRDCLPPQAKVDPGAPSPEKALERRSGRPFSNSAAVLSSSFFLPNTFTAEQSEYPSTIFVLEDFMRSFFEGGSSEMRPIATASGG
ncbi:hypothetical protein M406DRAFT_332004 [Cryphonectria parasitica EP155]|uniref:Uncharacterized protein n=1 Tax=Cryphonectria parasitica (strain ATCC 38755 / EP155) TaxID=660469 RepID=A0A9P5CN29_CRYP1|nr:uncharacterized protein M406DRAFT_332004 [Cryphonectria parasitica EP155]KAF3763490.1 hypothetical protein M406DRAFT_332004 [Cryphonectria parasitica EP155]